jgi:hypothetical protein
LAAVEESCDRDDRPPWVPIGVVAAAVLAGIAGLLLRRRRVGAVATAGPRQAPQA